MSLIPIITLAVVVISLAFQIMNREATNRAIKSVEVRVAVLESIAALADLKDREDARRSNIGGGK